MTVALLAILWMGAYFASIVDNITNRPAILQAGFITLGVAGACAGFYNLIRSLHQICRQQSALILKIEVVTATLPVMIGLGLAGTTLFRDPVYKLCILLTVVLCLITSLTMFVAYSVTRLSKKPKS